MTGVVIAGCFWVLAAAATAMLPMRTQMIPGLTLLIAAPILIVWIGIEAGWVAAVIGVVAFGSMFRWPLIHLVRLASGREGGT